MIHFIWWAPQKDDSWNPGDENNILYPLTYINKFLFLQTINIMVNSLKHIDPLAFEGLPILRRVHISLHNLHQVPDFSAIRGTLESFSLSYCRGTCGNIDLKPPVDLKSLIIEKSSLRVVPRDLWHVASSLKFLVLSNNQISTLSNMYDIAFHKLGIVLLNFNNISHLSHAFLQLPVLQIFAIKHNKLTRLADISSCFWDGGHNKSVAFLELDVGSNPWHCNGSIEWIKTSICHRQR